MYSFPTCVSFACLLRLKKETKPAQLCPSRCNLSSIRRAAQPNGGEKQAAFIFHAREAICNYVSSHMNFILPNTNQNTYVHKIDTKERNGFNEAPTKLTTLYPLPATWLSFLAARPLRYHADGSFRQPNPEAICFPSPTAGYGPARRLPPPLPLEGSFPSPVL